MQARSCPRGLHGTFVERRAPEYTSRGAVTSHRRRAYPILYAYYGSGDKLDREAVRRQIECCANAGAGRPIK